MIYLFSGNDKYESYKAAKLFATNLAFSQGKEILILESESLKEPSEFTQYLEGIDMFSAGYVILLKRLSSNKRILKYFEENIESIKKYDIILWEDGKIGKIIEKEAEVLKYEISFFNSYSKMRQWFTDQAKLLGIKLGGAQIEKIAQNHNLDKYMFINEIEKIALYLKSENKEGLTEDELNSLLTKDIDTEIWDILENFANKKKVEAAREFLEIASVTDISQFLITMLDWQISNAYRVKYFVEKKLDLSLLNIKPKPMGTARSMAERTSWKEIERMADKLFDLDVAIKSGELDYKTGLTLYLLNI